MTPRLSPHRGEPTPPPGGSASANTKAGQLALACALLLGCGAPARSTATAVQHAAPAPMPPDCPEPTATQRPSAESSGPPQLPSVRLDKEAVRFDDESYTVWGASYSLRSRPHHDEVTAEPIRITGYVTRTNLEAAPPCAVHRPGQADAEGCRAELPTFWLGDSPDAPESECIKVTGFASNFAQIYQAIATFDSGARGAAYQDEFWGTTVPNPLPAKGAKVVVQGKYGTSFARLSSAMPSDVTMGILSFEEMMTLEPAPEPATLPGLKRKAR
jgi:hypothetical protein